VSTANNVTALQFNCDTDLSRRWTIRVSAQPGFAASFDHAVTG
jgi:hypothetical protein